MKNIQMLTQMKIDNEKITMMTAYDYPSAKQVEAAKIDMILVGDSLGMTVLGYDSTVQVTLDDMVHHSKAARRGAPNTFIVSDMPIGTVGIELKQDLNHALKLYQETGCNAIKVEGSHFDFIQSCRDIGIPVVGHLGLTPQSVGVTGYTVQAKSKEAAKKLIGDAQRIEESGAVMLVLEAVPSDLAAHISQLLHIPVIGIGAGIDTDGQVLVYHDVLQYGTDRKPKFVKVYGDFTSGVEALATFNQEVKEGLFPDDNYTYKVKIMDEVI